MAVLRNKPRKGNNYWVIVTSRRQTVNGKKTNPKEVVLKYIGSDKQLSKYFMELYESTHSDEGNVPTQPRYLFHSYMHGAPIALYEMGMALGLPQLLDESFPRKTINNVPRSIILLIGAIYRALTVGSKKAFADWVKDTSLSYHLGLDLESFTSQVFWEAMDGIDDEAIKTFQSRLLKRLEFLFDIDFENLHLDYTNFYTFISSKNILCTIAQRGHNKQKRNDLRQFSLAVLTAYALQIPLVTDIYKGNKNDQTAFGDFVPQIKSTFEELGVDPQDVTITFDGGSNNIKNLSEFPFFLVCSFSLASKKELYNISIDRYSEIEVNGKARLAYDVGETDFWGIQGKGVLTFSQDLYDGNMAELDKNLKKAEETLEKFNEDLAKPSSALCSTIHESFVFFQAGQQKIKEYNEQLEKDQAEGKNLRKKSKPLGTYDGCEQVRKLALSKLTGKYVKDIVKVTVTEGPGGTYALSYKVDPEKKATTAKTYFGKKLTVTTHMDWDAGQILKAYYSEECVESLFRDMKNPVCFSVRPQFHWTDDKIKVHTLMCMLAVTITEVMCIKLHDLDVQCTKESLIKDLKEIRDGWLIEKAETGNSHKVKRIFEDISEEQVELLKALQMACTEIGTKVFGSWKTEFLMKGYSD